MGGSGGGGSGAGVVDYPPYMKLTHSDWLNQGDGTVIVDNISQSIADTMNAAFTTAGGNPWSTALAYNPNLGGYLVNLKGAFTAGGAGAADLILAWNYKQDWVEMVELVTIPQIFHITVEDLIVIDKVVAALVISDIVIDDIAADAISDLAIDDVVVGDMAVGVITEAEILTDSASFANSLDDELTTKVLPRFRRGMQDINSVVSSSFVVGQSIIEGFRTRDVAKHESGMRVTAVLKNADTELAADQTNIGKDVSVGKINTDKAVTVGKVNLDKNLRIITENISKNLRVGEANINKDVEVGKLLTPIEIANLTKDVEVGKINTGKAVDVGKANAMNLLQSMDLELKGIQQLIQLKIQQVVSSESVGRGIAEVNRIAIVAETEYKAAQNKIDEGEAAWDLGVFQYGANLLAAIAGAVNAPAAKKPDVMVSTLGGAMSGAAAGAAIGAAYGTSAGPGYGTAIGAVLGAALGFMSSQ